MSNSLSLKALALAFTAVFTGGCEGKDTETYLRETFIGALKNREIELSIESFERLAKEFTVTEAEVIEAAWLMHFCLGDTKNAAGYIANIDPKAILQTNNYIHLIDADPEVVLELNEHYYRSFFHTKISIVCSIESYDHCQSIIKKSLDKISENMTLNPLASGGLSYIEIDEILWIQSLSEESLHIALATKLEHSMNECEKYRRD